MHQLKANEVLDGLREMSQTAPIDLSDNLISGLMDEITRNREILREYEAIGAAGIFGATILRYSIVKAEQAIRDGDTVGMLYAYNDLKETC
jgi:hypothetical protein